VHDFASSGVGAHPHRLPFSERPPFPRHPDGRGTLAPEFAGLSDTGKCAINLTIRFWRNLSLHGSKATVSITRAVCIAYPVKAHDAYTRVLVRKRGCASLRSQSETPYHARVVPGNVNIFHHLGRLATDLALPSAVFGPVDRPP